MSETMQKTKTKTGIAVALVTFSIISSVAAATIIIRRQGGSSLISSVRNVISRTPVGITTVPSTSAGVTSPVTTILATGKFRPTSQQPEYWRTSFTQFISVVDSVQDHTSKYVPGGSITIDKKIAVRRQVGKPFTETFTVAFSSVHEIDSASLRCEEGYPDAPGINVTSKEIGANKIECTISGTPTKEQSLRISMGGKIKPYSVKMPDYKCVQADITSGFYTHIPECVTGGVGTVIPGKDSIRSDETIGAMPVMVFTDCVDGQIFNRATGKCEDLQINSPEPAGILDLTYWSNQNYCADGNHVIAGAGKDMGTMFAAPENRYTFKSEEIKHFKYVVSDPAGSFHPSFENFVTSVLFSKNVPITDVDKERMKNAGQYGLPFCYGKNGELLAHEKDGVVVGSIQKNLDDGAICYLPNGYNLREHASPFMKGVGIYYLSLYNNTGKEVPLFMFVNEF